MSLVNRIRRNRQSSKGWNILRTEVISSLFESEREVVVQAVRYSIQATIAVGGYSVVYKAVDQDGHEVALKVANVCNEDNEINERLVAEPQLLMKVKSCLNVVKLLDHEMISRELSVIVMELGQETLADVLARDELTLTDLRRYWSSILSCVSDLHSNNIIHGDIKPENFLLVNGDMKIIDLGLSVAMPANVSSVELDQTYGTGPYLAPECEDSRLSRSEGHSKYISTVRSRVFRNMDFIVTLSLSLPV